jgi:hypothetical protein
MARVTLDMDESTEELRATDWLEGSFDKRRSAAGKVG